MMSTDTQELDEAIAKIEANAHSERAKNNSRAQQCTAAHVEHALESVDVKTAARIVSNQRKKEIGRNTLYKLLRDHGLIIADNVPRVMYCPRFFKPLLTSYETDGIEHYVYKTLITAEGIALVCEILDDVEAIEREQKQPHNQGDTSCH